MDGRTILILSGAGLVGLACGTTRLNAGSNGDGGTPGADDWKRGRPSLSTPSNSFDVTCDLPAPDWLAGAWQGEFDTFALPSGAKAVRIEFTGESSAANQLCGIVTFGEGVPPPVATDPQAQPPGLNDGDVAPQGGFIEGFAYEFGTASDVNASSDADAPAPPGVEGRRVRFGITPNQIYKSWCNLQLSYQQVDLSMTDLSNLPRLLYRCVPAGSYSNSSNGWNWVACDSRFNMEGTSCAQALYCYLEVCECHTAYRINGRLYSEVGCTVVPTGATKFDLSLADTILSGNVLFIQSAEGLHLTRIP